MADVACTSVAKWGVGAEFTPEGAAYSIFAAKSVRSNRMVMLMCWFVGVSTNTPPC